MTGESYIWDRYQQKVVLKSEYRPPERKSDMNASALFAKPIERGSWVYDRSSGQLVARGDYHRPLGADGPQIISDIEPYQPVAANRDGSRPEVIGGRRQHRDFLKANGYVEIGNEVQRDTRQLGPRPGEIAAELKRILGE